MKITAILLSNIHSLHFLRQGRQMGIGCREGGSTMDRPVFWAHTADDGRRQSGREHCRNAAEYASAAAGGVGLSRTAYLAALLHDAGKFKAEFADYLENAGGAARRGSVNHSFAGVRFVLDRWHGSGTLDYAELTAELIAFAIGAHHGLFDCIGEKGENGFLRRRTKPGIHYEESIENYLAQCAGPEELDGLFRLAEEEMTPILEKIAGLSRQEDPALGNSETYFYAGLLGRMLLSAVIEGDRRDTAEFMDRRTFPAWPTDMRPVWADTLERFERKLGELPCDQPIQKARRVISDRCRAFAEQPGGVLRLNVPTGGGKTLSGLRYALAHAEKYNKTRIILTSPLLSILDQNAKVIRSYIADDRMILEHHSNLEKTESRGEQLDRWELLTETWDAPIIITTLVQLLNTIFSGKTGAIRRFHALCGSVIVIDEVQTVPGKMLTLFNLAVNFLSEVCGATVILCSATQPSLEAVPHPLRQTPRDMIPREQALWDVFKRTEIHDAGGCRTEELPQLIRGSLADCGSLLVVCNKKDQAAFLFRALSGGGPACFHLSAAMCPAHRRAVLQEMGLALAESRAGGRQVVCVSTQVIEAGVDISFQRVIRLAAGMDSVIQSAGRCNRNAESAAPARVSIVQCTDENLSRLEDIRRGKTAAMALLSAFRRSPEEFHDDLAGDEAIAFYYRRLYRSMDAGFQDDPVGEYGTLFDLLADNTKYADADCPEIDRTFLHQAFRLSGRLFQVFDQDTVDVLVPYGRGRGLREELIALSRPGGPRDFSRIRELMEQAKLYSVSLYQYQFDRLTRQGALIPLFDGSVYALADGFYDDSVGFYPEKNAEEFWGV